jgi:dynein light chain LC8-type
MTEEPPISRRNTAMDPAFEELERRSRYLSSLVRRSRLADPPEAEPEKEAGVEPKLKAVEPGAREGKGDNAEAADGKDRTKVKAKGAEERKVTVKVRAADMPLPLQRRAVRVAAEAAAATPKLESKRLALALKKVCLSMNTQIVSPPPPTMKYLLPICVHLIT